MFLKGSGFIGFRVGIIHITYYKRWFCPIDFHWTIIEGWIYSFLFHSTMTEWLSLNFFRIVKKYAYFARVWNTTRRSVQNSYFVTVTYYNFSTTIICKIQYHFNKFHLATSDNNKIIFTNCLLMKYVVRHPITQLCSSSQSNFSFGK